MPDAALLDDFIRRFPEFEKELIAYAIDLAVEAAIDLSVSPRS